MRIINRQLLLSDVVALREKLCVEKERGNFSMVSLRRQILSGFVLVCIALCLMQNVIRFICFGEFCGVEGQRIKRSLRNFPAGCCLPVKVPAG